jgi:hypothetical protein
MRLIATLLLLAISGPLLAQGFSYNYIEGSWFQTELDVGDTDVDGDGFGLYGSVEVGTMWHVFANFTSSSLSRDVDFDQTWIGGGLHTPLAPNMDLYFNLAYVNVESNGLGSAFDNDGLGTALGVRMMLRPQIEVSGALSYSELGDNSTTGIEGKAWYIFTRNLAVGGGVGFEDDLIRYGVAVRYYWD